MQRGTQAGRAIALIGLAGVVLLWQFVPGRSAAVDPGVEAAPPARAEHELATRALVEAPVDASGRSPVEVAVDVSQAPPAVVHEENVPPDAVWSLLVRIVTPAGEDVRSLLEKEWLRGPAGPGVFVTLDPPSDRVPADSDRDGSILVRPRFTEERDDHVRLHLDPPLYVSVVFGESVLATQYVGKRVDGITFVLDLDRFRQARAGLVVRVLDCESGMPASNASANLNTDEMTEATTPADGQGVVRFEKRVPGLYELWIRSKGCAMHRQTVELPPGQVTDLGTITLEKGTEIRGVCVDDEGAPRRVSAGLVPLVDIEDGRERLVHVRFSLSVDERGRFSIGSLARGRYMTWVDPAPPPGEKSPGEPGWETSPILVDTRAGPVEDLRIVVSRPATVTLRPTQAAVGLRYDVITTAGLVYRFDLIVDDTPQRLELAAGSYKLRLSRRRELVREIPFTVGKDPVDLDVGP